MLKYGVYLDLKQFLLKTYLNTLYDIFVMGMKSLCHVYILCIYCMTVE
jgi:hypothetical protein